MSTARRTVGETLVSAATQLGAAGNESARLDAEVLLAWVLGGERTLLITRRDEALAEDAAHRFADLVARRLAGEPVAYLTGEREFYSLPFRVDRRVLVPRPETEGVVDTALEVLARLVAAPGGADGGRRVRVVDVGTGSGALAVALAHECRVRWPGSALALCALDLSAAALAVARANAARILGPGSLGFVRANLLSALAARSLDLVVANPPYLSDDELRAVSAEVACEPVAALRGGGKDGAGILRELLTDATRVLRPGGFLVSEIGTTQGGIVGALARDLGFEEVRVLPDLAGHDRVLAARWRNGPAAR